MSFLVAAHTFLTRLNGTETVNRKCHQKPFLDESFPVCLLQLLVCTCTGGVGTGCYGRQTKFGEGNVFTGICCLFGGGIVTSNASLDRSHGRVPPDMRTWVPSPPPLLTSGGHHWRPVQTCSLEGIPTPFPSMVLTPCGSHWNMYGWLADGTHPTGMLSSWIIC